MKNFNGSIRDRYFVKIHYSKFIRIKFIEIGMSIKTRAWTTFECDRVQVVWVFESQV